VNDILKQRLVGALILVALGVVFWPIIFVQPGDEAALQRAPIPERPGVAVTPLEVPDVAGLRGSPELTASAQEEPPEPEVVEPVVTVSSSAQEASAIPTAAPPAPVVAAQPAARTRSEAPEKLVMDSDGVPVAWILQVATVSSADKADELRQRLLKVDQKAYVKRVKRGGKNLYRVYIGPKFERARLESIQPRIDAEFGVQSMIARYLP
jgi:DedD protein